MRSDTRRVLPVTAALLLALCAQNVQAQVCEFPLPIMRNVPDGNVLFILDSSASMNEIVYHTGYDADVTYGGAFKSSSTYTVKQDGNFAPNDFVSGAATTPEIYLINSDNAQAGWYIGNYLNWLYYNATAAQIASMPLVTRIQAAKAVVSKLVLEHLQIRFGVMKFNASGDGATLIAKVGSPRENIINQVMGVAATGTTPIAESLISAEEYLRVTGNLEVVEYECQQTFIVVLTDGYPTDDLNVPAYISDYDGDGREPGNCASIGAPYSNSLDCSDYMDDVAGYLRDVDLRPDLDGRQNATTYVVGYYIDAPLLQQTADNGGGLFFTAKSTEALDLALQNVLRDIIQRISAGSAVAVISSENQTDDMLFRTRYLPVKWQGFLEAFVLPYEDGETPAWEAGSLLATRSSESRTIFTAMGSSKVPFTIGSAGALQPRLGVATSTEAEELVDWTRGDELLGYRDRDGWKFGDIVHSAPVTVGAPASFSLDADYAGFRATYEHRRRMVYVGANDAMLHAFDTDTGEEVWSFIPESQLPRLKSIASPSYCHEYSVDLAPRVVDAKVSGAWRTMLLGGLRQGGNSYYALDISDPDNPRYLWETTIPGLHGSWATPAIARVAWHTEPVFIVTTGPDFTNYDASAIICDMSTGAVLQTVRLSTDVEVNMGTSAVTLDVDHDGIHDLAYMGDLTGRLWRMDIRQSTPDVTLLFEGTQPIQARPALTVDYNGDVMVYFGTGKYLEVSDFDNVTQQTVYCVIDNHNLSRVSRSDLVDQTSSITQLRAADRGWYVDMNAAAGERMTQPAVLAAGIVYATSFQPTAKLCGFGGHSWLYRFNFRTGAGGDDDEDSTNDTTDDRVEDIGDGIASQPVLDVVNEEVLVQGSDTRIHVRDTVGQIQLIMIRSWRTRYN